MSPGNLSLLERGKINYTQDSLQGVAAALDVNVDDLFRDPTDPLAGLFNSIRDAAPATQRQIAEITRTLLKTAADS